MNSLAVAIGVIYTGLNAALWFWALRLASPEQRRAFLILAALFLLFCGAVTLLGMYHDATHPNYGESE